MVGPVDRAPPPPPTPREEGNDGDIDQAKQIEEGLADFNRIVKEELSHGNFNDPELLSRVQGAVMVLAGLVSK